MRRQSRKRYEKRHFAYLTKPVKLANTLAWRLTGGAGTLISLQLPFALVIDKATAFDTVEYTVIA